MTSRKSSELEIVNVDVYAVKDLVRSGHRYIDVRTEEEFKNGHADVENLINIPYMFFTPEGRVKNPKFVEQVMSAFNKDEHLVMGCKSGVRSTYAATDLLNADFRHVSNMAGGYDAWVEKGLSVKKPKVEATDYSEL